MADNASLQTLTLGIIIICWMILVPGVCGYIMSQKGNSAVIGVLAGFFLSVLGLLICMAIPPNKEELNKRSRDKGVSNGARGNAGTWSPSRIHHA